MDARGGGAVQRLAQAGRGDVQQDSRGAGRRRGIRSRVPMAPAGAGRPKAAASQGGGGKKEDVVDADFKEVK